MSGASRECSGRFPVSDKGASITWRGAKKEVSGVALVVAQEAPTSSTMAVPHGPAGVGAARRRMREELLGLGAPEAVVEDAVLVFSELLSNAYRHARPLGAGNFVHAAWGLTRDGGVSVSVTDGGGPTRPRLSNPSVTARGGRGLSIITSLARDWGVRDGDEPGEVTVWAVVPPGDGGFSASMDFDLVDLDDFA
ncbi:ATP-binding protein [Streptomyces megasporus]|uniref:ATP-binding protein n=1 Tax=Streptomyces megasporus TaxID=44060 RepID=UPI001FE048F4|nr:ATP-binding protein [Streptomyces megasporus]